MIMFSLFVIFILCLIDQEGHAHEISQKCYGNIQEINVVM
jgi:hypothetical protein